MKFGLKQKYILAIQFVFWSSRFRVFTALSLLHRWFLFYGGSWF